MLMCKKLSTEEQRYCDELYSKYKRFMYSTAKTYVCPGLTAEDIVQNASVKLANNSELFRTMDEPAAFTYVNSTVRSVAFDYYRQTHRDERLILQAETIYDGCSRSAEADYMDFANNELLEKVLDSLDDRDRLLLTGKFYLRLSDAALAEMVGCKPDSVRTLVMRAKKKAQKKLIKEGFKHDEI